MSKVGIVTADVTEIIEGGDHRLFVGTVISKTPNRKPLMFFAGSYAEIDLGHPVEDASVTRRMRLAIAGDSITLRGPQAQLAGSMTEVSPWNSTT